MLCMSQYLSLILQVENSSGAVNDATNTVMQKFWDSALNLEPPDDYDTQRYIIYILNMYIMEFLS